MAGNLNIKNANGKTLTIQNPDTNNADITIDGSKVVSNINGYSDKATPVDTDNIVVQETGGIFKKLSWSNLKATLFDGSMSLTINGYIKLPTIMGGLIIQWGYVPNVGNRQVAITFPITFPNAILNGSITTNNSTVVADNGGSVFAMDKSGMAAALNAGYAFYWFAIGY